MHLTVRQILDILATWDGKGRIISHSSCGNMIILERPVVGIFRVQWYDGENDCADFNDLSDAVEFYNEQCTKLFD